MCVCVWKGDSHFHGTTTTMPSLKSQTETTLILKIVSPDFCPSDEDALQRLHANYIIFWKRQKIENSKKIRGFQGLGEYRGSWWSGEDFQDGESILYDDAMVDP